ncbi:MAG: DUF192 domain-containing protein [Patescibacteria group bacterium]
MEKLLLFIKENIRLLIGAGVVIFIGLFLITLVISKKTTLVSVGNQTFKVKVAATDQQKQIGLSETKSLKQNQGMLFVFDNPDYYRFWMKNMNFPIDIIYIREEKVITVISNAKVQANLNDDLIIYSPKEKSDKVLEINAGLANKYAIKEGSVVKIQNL